MSTTRKKSGGGSEESITAETVSCQCRSTVVFSTSQQFRTALGCPRSHIGFGHAVFELFAAGESEVRLSTVGASSVLLDKEIETSSWRQARSAFKEHILKAGTAAIARGSCYPLRFNADHAPKSRGFCVRLAPCVVLEEPTSQAYPFPAQFVKDKFHEIAAIADGRRSDLVKRLHDLCRGSLGAYCKRSFNDVVAQVQLSDGLKSNSELHRRWTELTGRYLAMLGRDLVEDAKGERTVAESELPIVAAQLLLMFAAQGAHGLVSGQAIDIGRHRVVGDLLALIKSGHDCRPSSEASAKKSRKPIGK